MTREQLSNKEIKKLNNLDEAIELINILTYDECIKLLQRLKNTPVEIFNALINRAKKLNNNKIGFDLAVAAIQNNANKEVKNDWEMEIRRHPGGHRKDRRILQQKPTAWQRQIHI